MDPAFREAMAQGYALTEPALVLGSPLLGDTVLPEVRVQIALAMMNRHGLIAGATGTGKTKTLQVMAGELSDAGVPVFISDIKGDVTGIAVPGDATNPKIQERIASLQYDYRPAGHPVEFLSLSGSLGAQLRATVHSFGPLLLGKVLDLNETQTAVMSLVFQYCDDHDLPLLDLADLRTTLNYLASDEGKELMEQYGGMSKATVGVMLRSLITLEQSGADAFFGEPEFDVHDLMRMTPDGRGVISVLELSDVMDKPRLFSTFMLWMLAQLYSKLPEMGDLPKPKLAFFFDEAHLLFDDASKALMDQVELTVRLIRSKGVGVYFVTQSPTDVPSSVLAQLGSRVQHALRAFTPEDADNLRKTARTFPTSEFYDVEKQITSLGIGEALVTVLSPRGVPTPLAATRLVPPDSFMGALEPAAFQDQLAAGALRAKYGQAIDRDSAHEMITRRIASARTVAAGPAVAPTTGTGLNTMTPAQQRREVARQQREIAAAERAAARAQKQAQVAAEREWRERQRHQATAARQASREREAMIRETSRVIRSRSGQSIIRSVFGTLFGGK
ncbi:MAG: DUF853 family protein [Chloroflexi bacterium]|nr:DUF853 family protein [Chloroflexota bacterium]